MKVLLTLICFFTFHLCLAQQKPEQNSKTTVFTLGEKPIGPTDCFQLTDFKQRLNVESLPAALDSVTFDLYLVRGLRPIATLKLKTLKDFREFDYFKWLSTGQKDMDDSKNTGSKTEPGTAFSAQPGDRLLIEMNLMHAGKTIYKYQNLHFCKP